MSDEIEVEVHEGNPRTATNFSIRLSTDELRTIRRRADTEGISTGQFIRRAAMAAALGEFTSAEDAFVLLRRLAESTDSAIMLLPRSDIHLPAGLSSG